MKIVIEFDSIWQNSFLYGDNDEIPKGKKKGDFKATSRNDKIDHKKITKSTVLGILSRLIGDQRKLYQARESDDYYFRDKEDLIDFQVIQSKSDTWSEKVFITNKNETRPHQRSYLGVIKDDEKLFFSETAPMLWSILYMSIDEVLDFIISDKMSTKRVNSKPDFLLKRIEVIQNFDTLIFTKDIVLHIEKAIENKKENFLKKEQNYLNLLSPSLKQSKSISLAKEKMEEEIDKLKGDIEKLLNSKNKQSLDLKLKKVLDLLSKNYPEQVYYEKGRIFPMSLYSVSLYLQVERMLEENLEGVELDLNNGKIQGFSKRYFNGVRDFLNKLAGNYKKTTGTPYPLTKASGILEINIDIERDEAKLLKQFIENAGLSSFYLRKKGLAYVTNIDTRKVN